MPRPDLPAPLVFARDQAAASRPCAATVGNFDGVHLGHAAIAARLMAAAERHGVPAVAVTFDPHPASVLRPDAAPVPLTTPRRRAELLLSLGLDAVHVQPATAALLGRQAEAFYDEILVERLRVRALVEGADFRFGAGRRGDVALLADLCRRDGVALEVVPAVVVGGGPVSSSRLRTLIAAGAVAEANSLAIAPYRLTGTVVVGARRGATLGFPTANLSGIDTLLPGGGVYAGRVPLDGAWHAAAVHVGPNVSFGETAISVEVHLVGFGGDLYGRSLDVDLLERVRDTRRFASVDELTSQLAADVAAASRIVADAPAPHGKA